MSRWVIILRGLKIPSTINPLVWPMNGALQKLTMCDRAGASHLIVPLVTISCCVRLSGSICRYAGEQQAGAVITVGRRNTADSCHAPCEGVSTAGRTDELDPVPKDIGVPGKQKAPSTFGRPVALLSGISL